MDKKRIVAIDGPSGVGKSSVAKALSKRLGFKHINTGSMFRAIGYKAIKEGLKEDAEIIEMAESTKINFKFIEDDNKIIVDGIDLSEELSSPNILPEVARISAIPGVRQALMKMQRKFGEDGDAVFEGRDIGTNIFPDAKWKFYLDAKSWKRAERLKKVLDEEGLRRYPTHEDLIRLVEEIDKKDKNREIAPLRIADDAIYYDSTSSPTAEHDATVLWYYMTHEEEIKDNVERSLNNGL
jgi:CMP/dCMP kinase